MQEVLNNSCERERHLNAEINILHGVPTSNPIQSLIELRGICCNKVELSIVDVPAAVDWQHSVVYGKTAGSIEPTSIPARILAIRRHLFPGHGNYSQAAEMLLDLWCTLDQIGSGLHEDREAVYLMAHDFDTQVLIWLLKEKEAANMILLWLTTEILATLATWQCSMGKWQDVDSNAELAMKSDLPFHVCLSILRLQSLVAPLLHDNRPQGPDHLEAFDQIEQVDESGRLFACQTPDNSTVQVGLSTTAEDQFVITKREHQLMTVVVADHQLFVLTRRKWLWNLVTDQAQAVCWGLDLEQTGRLNRWTLEHQLGVKYGGPHEN